MSGRLVVVMASANPHKVGEIADILGDAVEVLPRPGEVADVVEDAPTLEGNARLKAVAISDATGQAAVADDTGLEVGALDGAPGVRSARFAGDDAIDADNVALLLQRLAGVDVAARSARFRTVALIRFPDGFEVIATGVVEGTIASSPRGDSGFGYDPVFVPADGDGRTFAEMTPADKHQISHRGRAFRRLRDELGRTGR